MPLPRPHQSRAPLGAQRPTARAVSFYDPTATSQPEYLLAVQPQTLCHPYRRALICFIWMAGPWGHTIRCQRMSDAHFQGFLEASPDAVIVVDRTGRINLASNRIEAMFGHLPKELVGKPLSVLMPERFT